MKYLSFPTLSVLAGVSLLAFVPQIRAEIQVNDNVVSGAFDPEGNQHDEALLKWPEEVQFSSPFLGAPQDAGTSICNLTAMRADVDSPAWSRVVGQMFHIPEDADQILEKIFIVARVTLPGNTPMKLRPRLVDLGTSPSADEYDAGTNLFSGDPAIEIATPSEKNSAQIVEFTFTGNDRVRLKKGHSYAFELVGDEENKNSSIFVWYRNLGQPSDMKESPVFFVGHKESSTANDQREGLKNRQAFIGIKTSPAN